jgi:GNAT superfamily N-acetyltransferase
MPVQDDTTDDLTFRPATHDDHDDVAAFTQDTWDGGDYLADVYPDWIEGENKRTLVADAGDEIAGIAQMVMLSGWEAWGQGLRVNPTFRGHGVSERITYELFDWARDQGATVARVMVFSWNQAGLGQARSTGYDPVSEFRWLQPDPDPDADPTVHADPDAAWSFWTDSEAREQLGGLALSMDESWATQELTREMLARAADETALLAVGDDDGTHALSYRTRTFERETDDGETETWAEYGVGAWEHLDAAAVLRDAIAADAAEIGADRTRVLIPETVRFVSDGASLRANIAEEPDFLLAADLTATLR